MHAPHQLKRQGSASSEGRGLAAVNARALRCVTTTAGQEQHLANVVEVSVRRSLLGKELLVSIQHDMQVELLLQQHEAMVAEALDGAHGSNLAHPVCLKHDDCKLSCSLQPPCLLCHVCQHPSKGRPLTCYTYHLNFSCSRLSRNSSTDNSKTR